MTPITRPEKLPNITTGRLETFSATSADGAWCYVRTEEHGTPWMVTRRDDGRWTLTASLAKARRLTALPNVDDYLTAPV